MAKTNPLTKYTAREIHDEFYQPELLRAEADTPPEVRTKDRHAAKNDAGKSTKPKQLVSEMKHWPALSPGAGSTVIL